jgi:hypothetical protein
MEDDHPPVNGTLVLLCFEEEVAGSFCHVGRYNTTSTGKPLLVANGMFGFDLPKVLFWQVVVLPWHQGHQKPVWPSQTM